MARESAPRRVVLPAEPLVDGATALRRWRDSDVPAITAACQDPLIPRWTRVPSPYHESDARAHLLHLEHATKAAEIAPFAIVAADDRDRLLGSVSVMRLNWHHRRGEVGYWLAADARGEGHVTRAVRLVCTWAFATLPLERIELLASTGNPASQNVARRAGFTEEAVLRSHTLGSHGREDMVSFALLKEG